MGEFKEAWDRKTGERLPYMVPATHFEHPWFRDAISDRPPSVGGEAGKKAPAAATKEEK